MIEKGDFMIPIVFSGNGNKKIFEGLLMCVISLAKQTNEALDIIVLTMDLTKENPNFNAFSQQQIALLDKMVKEKNKESRARKFDVTNLYMQHLHNGKNHENGYTPFAMLRLLIDFIPEIPDKIIYMDIDTMCVSDIKQLYDLDVTGYDFIACKDYMGRFWIRPSYCNSGVLVLNIKQMKEDGLFVKCRDMVNRKKMLMPDQTALNKYGKKKYMPFRFNEQRKIKSDTVVKHFCKGIVFFLPFGFHIYNIKQWQREKVHKSLKIHNFDDIYKKVDALKEAYPNCF